MPRTLVVTNDFPPRQGGIETFVHAMTERFAPDGVVVYTSSTPGAAAFDSALPVEGLGIVFLEAAAAGLPVLVGNSGGAPDAVLDGGTGRVVGDTPPCRAPRMTTGAGRRVRAWR
nr:glycosyltransferase [Kitasatospora sp. MY 5-36]